MKKARRREAEDASSARPRRGRRGKKTREGGDRAATTATADGETMDVDGETATEMAMVMAEMARETEMDGDAWMEGETSGDGEKK